MRKNIISIDAKEKILEIIAAHPELMEKTMAKAADILKEQNTGKR